MVEQPVEFYSDTHKRPGWLALLGIPAAVLPAAVVMGLARAFHLMPCSVVGHVLFLGAVAGTTAATLIGLLRLAYGQRPRRLRVDHQGITAYFYARGARFYAWESIDRVAADGTCVRLTTRQGELVIDDQVTDWARLADRARVALGQAEPAPAREPTVQPEVVAEWLGIGPDGSLSASRTTSTVVLSGFLVAYLVVFLGSAVRADVGWLAAPFVVALAVIAVVFVRVLAAAPLRVKADAWALHVLTISGWRSYGWNTLQDVRAEGESAVLVTRHGDIPLDNAAVTPQMMTAIRRAIEARREGEELPQIQDVPEGALSRMDGDQGEFLADHGLSRTDEQRPAGDRSATDCVEGQDA